MTPETDCFECDGQGWTTGMDADPLPSGEPGEPYQTQEQCSVCGGSGRLPLPAPALDVERLDDLVMEHSHHAPLLKGGWYVERKPPLDFLADLREGETK